MDQQISQQNYKQVMEKRAMASYTQTIAYYAKLTPSNTRLDIWKLTTMLLDTTMEARIII